MAGFELVPANTNLVLDAHQLARAEQFSWFEALIVEADIRSGFTRLFSEDLVHGRRFGQMSVCNPFEQPGNSI